MEAKETPAGAPAKKTWASPWLLLISRNTVSAKVYPNVHEGTGKTVVTAVYSYYSNQAGTAHITLAKNGYHLGNKSSAAS
ncbi:hypothetical protein BEL04_10850 [Mucilaginibacter sp. PPCGB 2223]|uniref:hypothetical protein n=1 Tax=Mucilaginibacter sp. PPCGB 2223 TaxID=1886027 RepID=UPI000824BBB0|nr:hypothetical protein [Mucilaginibacter sp. PPCGB 2223]OCX54714.1 hypothetical protein BEL04_10850 [Mucilaginibacter sp. PPCGB 2223]